VATFFDEERDDLLGNHVVVEVDRSHRDVIAGKSAASPAFLTATGFHVPAGTELLRGKRRFYASGDAVVKRWRIVFKMSRGLPLAARSVARPPARHHW